MLYHVNSPYYQYFLSANKKQRTKIDAQNTAYAAQKETKNVNMAKPSATSAWVTGWIRLFSRLNKRSIYF